MLATPDNIRRAAIELAKVCPHRCRHCLHLRPETDGDGDILLWRRVLVKPNEQRGCRPVERELRRLPCALQLRAAHTGVGEEQRRKKGQSRNKGNQHLLWVRNCDVYVMLMATSLVSRAHSE
ncbi:hypothetical protein E2562_008406 [Oryza meyeriana var. granulata]|uniref:Uncharacterized protein n=1 Tax=Oryza meyeriana var. granulata TaxID=110450 RepID=A0A6G1EH48_9ORYZ|nr:hypothetical protein E2562_008406 [Oryza meyeriana var. granulata]